MESSQEANSQALQELSAKLQREYEEKLHEEQRKHREEIENLQVCILFCLFTSNIVSADNRDKNICVRTGLTYVDHFGCFKALTSIQRLQT